MAHASNRTAFRELRALYNVGTCAGLSDGQLLERFVHRGGEAAELAFAALVERHGPMVLRVCRRILNDPADAEDAFQAVFLVLVRRAGAVRQRESLASWLHGVALRVAGAARSARSRRAHHERRAAAQRRVTAESEWTPDDRAAVLHDEIGRMPERYRAAVVLCYLEGRTYDEAAQALGCPMGTIKSRLATARQMLGTRLARRGFAFSAGALVALLAGETASASVGRGLVEAAVRGATRNVAGKAAFAASLAAQSQGVFGMIATHKVRLTVLFALGIGAAGARVYVLGQQPRSVGDGTQVDAKPHAAVRGNAAGGRTERPVPIVRATRASIEQKLDQPVSFSSDDYPTLGPALSYLANRTGLNFVIDPKALASLGLATDSKVTLVCHDVRLASVLNMLLHPMKLTYRVEDQLILVSSDSNHEVVSRVYRLDDLIPNADGRVPSAEQRQDLLNIADLIQSSVAPGTWMNAVKRHDSSEPEGGMRRLGRITVNPMTMTLSITHEQDVQDRIAERIAQLRRLKSGKDAPPDTGERQPSQASVTRANAPETRRTRAIFIPQLASMTLSEDEARMIRDSFIKAMGENTHYTFADRPGEADLIIEWTLSPRRGSQ